MMQSISDYFAMGGHAAFIWTAYGAAAIILGGLLVMSRKDLRTRQTEIAALEASSPRRRQQAQEVKSS